MLVVALNNQTSDFYEFVADQKLFTVEKLGDCSTKRRNCYDLETLKIQKSLWGTPTPTLLFFGAPKTKFTRFWLKKRDTRYPKIPSSPICEVQKFVLWAQKFILKSLHFNIRNLHPWHMQKTNRVQIFLLSKRGYIDECTWHLSFFEMPFLLLPGWERSFSNKLTVDLQTWNPDRRNLLWSKQSMRAFTACWTSRRP